MTSFFEPSSLCHIGELHDSNEEQESGGDGSGDGERPGAGQMGGREPSGQGREVHRGARCKGGGLWVVALFLSDLGQWPKLWKTGGRHRPVRLECDPELGKGSAMQDPHPLRRDP